MESVRKVLVKKKTYKLTSYLDKRIALFLPMPFIFQNCFSELYSDLYT